MFDSLLAVFEQALVSYGLVALFLIVFAESGLFFGFFFPGDSLLFIAGLLASQGIFQLEWTLAVVMVAAILGDQAGYWMGSKWGRGFFNKPNSIFFNPDHITKAEAFYKKHGKKTIVLARFVPAVRTFAPIVAGISRMNYGHFATYNVLGGILWTLIFVLGGYFLGSVFPDAGDYLTLLILGIIVLSMVPIGLELAKRHVQKKNKAKNK